MPRLVLRFDMRNPAWGCDKQSLYQAALEMSEWADARGFDIIQFSEHHGSEDGYLPSPIVLAAAVAARTRRVRLRMSLVILPLNHPLRVAEDLAVLDIVSGGRLEAVLGAGYVPHEFTMFDVNPARRGKLMEEGVSAIVQAWRGEPFEFQGRRVQVTPTPLQSPRPPLWLGGSSPAAARRAARLADYFYTSDASLYEQYRQEARRLGRDPGPWADIGTGYFVAAQDPEREWAEVEPYLLHEFNSYRDWLSGAGADGQYAESGVNDGAALRTTGLYPVMTPEDGLEYARSLGEDGQLCLHPLVGGQSPEIGWRQLRTFEQTLLPALRPGGGDVQ